MRTRARCRRRILHTVIVLFAVFLLLMLLALSEWCGPRCRNVGLVHSRLSAGRSLKQHSNLVTPLSVRNRCKNISGAKKTRVSACWGEELAVLWLTESSRCEGGRMESGRIQLLPVRLFKGKQLLETTRKPGLISFFTTLFSLDALPQTRLLFLCCH